jgi:hypothetical protein
MLLASRQLLVPSHCCHTPPPPGVVGTVAGVASLYTAEILAPAVAGVCIVSGVLAVDGGWPVSIFLVQKYREKNPQL